MITRKRVTAFLAALLVCVGFILPMPANAATNVQVLNNYIEDGYWDIGVWSGSSQRMYYEADSWVATSFPLLSGAENARQQWNYALGTSFAVSSAYTSAPLKMFATTVSDCMSRTGRYVDADAYGFTYHKSKSETEDVYENTDGHPVDHVNIYQAECYVFPNSFPSNTASANYNYIVKTITHEMGHAVGWMGHPNSATTSYINSCVMKQGLSSRTTLHAVEKAHLVEVYP